MIKTAKDYGANYVFVGTLTLFGNGATDCKTLYYKFLEKHYPELISLLLAAYLIHPSKFEKFSTTAKALSVFLLLVDLVYQSG
jgi:hypothetical protein